MHFDQLGQELHTHSGLGVFGEGVVDVSGCDVGLAGEGAADYDDLEHFVILVHISTRLIFAINYI